MTSTTERELRAELELMQRQYVTLCDNVRLRAQLIYGNAGNGKAEQAAEQTAELMQAVDTAKHQFQMHRERTSVGAYSLAALKVDAATASNSETGWEREE